MKLTPQRLKAVRPRAANASDQTPSLMFINSELLIEVRRLQTARHTRSAKVSQNFEKLDLAVKLSTEQTGSRLQLDFSLRIQEDKHHVQL